MPAVADLLSVDFPLGSRWNPDPNHPESTTEPSYPFPPAEPTLRDVRFVGPPGAYGTGVLEVGLGPVSERAVEGGPDQKASTIVAPIVGVDDVESTANPPRSVQALAHDLLANPEGWLAAPNPRLQGRKPIDLVGTEDERHVRNMLEAFEYGLF